MISRLVFTNTLGFTWPYNRLFRKCQAAAFERDLKAASVRDDISPKWEVTHWKSVTLARLPGPICGSAVST